MQTSIGLEWYIKLSDDGREQKKRAVITRAETYGAALSICFLRGESSVAYLPRQREVENQRDRKAIQVPRGPLLVDAFRHVVITR